MPSGTDGLMDGIQVPGDSRSKSEISQYPMDFTERVQSFFPECKFLSKFLSKSEILLTGNFLAVLNRKSHFFWQFLVKILLYISLAISR